MVKVFPFPTMDLLVLNSVFFVPRSIVYNFCDYTLLAFGTSVSLGATSDEI